MSERPRLLAALLLALALAGCAGPPPLPAPPTGLVPDLRGQWTGTWDGRPLSLLVVEQADVSGRSGVFLGSWVLFGERRPGIFGVLTSTVRGEALSSNVRGWLGRSGRALTMVLEADTGHGSQWLTLTLSDEDRLTGTGESDFAWGPAGAVALTRQSSREPR